MILFSAIPAFAYKVPERELVNHSRQLKTEGNKIVYADDGTEVQLVGLNVDSLEFSEGGWQMQKTMMEAMDNWHANIIRMPVHSKYWFQEDAEKQEKYRKLVDSLIAMASERGKYVDLDLHQYQYFKQDAYNFWKDAAERYKNNPTVLFGILNEPHTISWKQWRNGGVITKDNKTTKFYGHQQVVEMIRDLGAKNIIIAGGLDWGYDLRGIVGEAEGDSTVYALVDQGSKNRTSRAGYGIMYDTHIYPWKGRTADWDKMMGTARKMYPILSGENGWDNGTIKAIEGQEYEEDNEKWYTSWNPEFFAFVNDVETYGAYMNWTGWCFHPGSSPRIIDESTKRNNYDYSYMPTDYWGVYVKEEMNSVLGENFIANKQIVDCSSDIFFAKNAIDNDYDTMWKAQKPGEQYITVDMGESREIYRWAVRNVGANYYNAYAQLDNTVDYSIYLSADNINWNLFDEVKGNTAPVTERIVKPQTARYVKFVFSKTNYNNDGTLRIKDLFVGAHK
jgi:hypothetical protein